MSPRRRPSRTEPPVQWFCSRLPSARPPPAIENSFRDNFVLDFSRCLLLSVCSARANGAIPLLGPFLTYLIRLTNPRYVFMFSHNKKGLAPHAKSLVCRFSSSGFFSADSTARDSQAIHSRPKTRSSDSASASNQARRTHAIFFMISPLSRYEATNVTLLFKKRKLATRFVFPSVFCRRAPQRRAILYFEEPERP